MQSPATSLSTLSRSTIAVGGEARVHPWHGEKFGAPGTPFGSTEDTFVLPWPVGQSEQL